MQPVQDLTIDATVSRTQYQFVLRTPIRPSSPTWVPKLVDRLQHAAAARRRRQRPRRRTGLSAYRRPSTATPPARFGITPATVDNALYDAFGQRIVSTIFTQSNQYRVILEADPHAAGIARRRSDSIYLPSSAAAAARCRCRRIAKVAEQTAPLLDQPSRASSRRPPSPSTSRPAPRSARRSTRSSRREKEIGLPPSVITSFQGAALAFQASLVQRAVADPGGDRHRLHRAGRALRELHPPGHDPLDPAVGRRRRAARR